MTQQLSATRLLHFRTARPAHRLVASEQLHALGLSQIGSVPSTHEPVLQVTRRDWFRVVPGFLSPKFWRAQLTTHPGYSWYLSRVRSTVQEALQATGASQAVIVGHSAGGWLARAFLGDPQWFVGTQGPRRGRGRCQMCRTLRWPRS